MLEFPACRNKCNLEPGKLADLVLRVANPMEDISNTQRIYAVLADGRLYSQDNLDGLLAEVEAVVQEVSEE